MLTTREAAPYYTRCGRLLRATRTRYAAGVVNQLSTSCQPVVSHWQNARITANAASGSACVTFPHCLATDRKNLLAVQFGGYLSGQDRHSINLFARFGLEADWTPSGISARAPRLSTARSYSAKVICPVAYRSFSSFL